MRVRIIAGEFGGRFIQTPSGQATHPMGERVRSAMFNSLGSEVQGARVLDVFAGSGAVGLEALSRGAAIDTGRAKLFARISHVEGLLVLLMVVAATGMARGVTFG